MITKLMKALLAIAMLFCLAPSHAQTPSNASHLPANPSSSIRREPDQCQPWFDQLWQQVSQMPQQRAGQSTDALLSNLPPRCHANPWVAWLLGRLSPQTNPSKPQLPLHPFLQDVEQMQLAADWIDQGRSQDAVPLLQALSRRQPDWAEVAYNLGLAYARLGDRQAAKQAWQRAMTLCEGRPCSLSTSALGALLTDSARD